MKFIIFILSCFLFCFSISAQSTWMEAEYEIALTDIKKFNEETKQFKQDNIRFSSKAYELKANSIFFKLTFNPTASFFNKIKTLNNDGDSRLNIVELLLTTNFVYSDVQTTLKKPKLKIFDNILIEVPKIDWQIESGTKNILGYKCSKAIGKYSVSTKDDIEEIIVIAWFTSQIPTPWGPDFYCGLPGLIFELSTSQNLNYKLLNLNFNTKTDFKKPEGRVISSNEYDDLVKKMRAKYNE